MPSLSETGAGHTNTAGVASPLVANGDVGSVVVEGGLTAAQAASVGTKVGVVSGKKQATVRAVPRVDQPLTTAQEKVRESINSHLWLFSIQCPIQHNYH